MKAFPLFVVVLSSSLWVQAAEPSNPSRRESLSPAHIASGSDGPIDNMPIIGDQTPLLRNRLQNLEERLRQTEEAQRKSGPLSAVEKKAGPEVCPPEAAPFGDQIRALEDRIRSLESKAGGTGNSNPALASTSAHPDPSDIYLQAYLLVQNAERAEMNSDPTSARASLEKARRLLTTIQQGFPQWQPAMVNFRKQKIEAALEKLDSNPPPEGKEDPARLLLEGIEHYQAERFDETVNSLTKSLALDPRNAYAHLWLSRVAKKKGWTEAAEKELATAQRLHPSLKLGTMVPPPATLLKPESGPATPPPID